MIVRGNPTAPHITPYHHLPYGISMSFLILSSAPVSNGIHSLCLIGECKFCHRLINVQVFAHAASFAPVSTSVHAHPCSHRGVRHRKTLTHVPICTCKLLSHSAGWSGSFCEDGRKGDSTKRDGKR